MGVPKYSPFLGVVPAIELDTKALQYMRVTDFEVVQQVNGIPSLRMTLKRKDTSPMKWDMFDRDVASFVPGTKIALSMPMPTVERTWTLFAGIVTSQRIVWDKDQSNPVLMVRAEHALRKLDGPLVSDIYQKRSDKSVLTELLEKYVTLGKNDIKGPDHEQLIQWRCSHWYWLRRRLRASGIWLLPHMDKVDCVLPSLSGARIHKIHPTADVPDLPVLEQVEWQCDNSTISAQMEGRHWDIAQQNVSPTVLANPAQIGSGGLDPRRIRSLTNETWQFYDAVSLVDGEMQPKLDGRFLMQHAAAVTTRLTLRADAQTLRYRLGDIVELGGLGTRASGRALMCGIRHRWDPPHFTTTVTTGLDDPLAIDAAALPRASALTVAVVADYEEDETQADRIRIRLPELGEQTIWARFAKPFASAGSGFHLYPKPKDEVLVAFIDDDPRYPVVLGATHNPVNMAPMPDDAKTDRQAWRGWIEVDDETKRFLGVNFADAHVRVESRDSVLHVGTAGRDSETDDHRSRLHIGKDGVDASGATITIDASDKVTVKGASHVAIVGKAIDLKQHDS